MGVSDYPIKSKDMMKLILSLYVVKAPLEIWGKNLMKDNYAMCEENNVNFMPVSPPRNSI
jgi:hypothetical protein